MKFTSFKAALSLSLLIHAGIGAVYLEWRHASKPDPVHSHLQQTLEIEVLPGRVLDESMVLAPAPVKSIPTPVTSLFVSPPIPPLETESAVVDEEKTLLSSTVEVHEVPRESTMEATSTVDNTVALSAKTGAASAAAMETRSSVPAGYLFNPKPAYPTEARRRKEEGVVILVVQLDPEGFPGNVQVLQSSNFPLLDEAAKDAVSHWRFTPARVGNMTVASQIKLPVRFKLSDLTRK